MANPIFQMMMSGQQQGNPFNQNPIELLAQKGINIPEENRGSSKDMVQYLLDSGAMNKNAFNSICNRLQMMGFKF